MLVSKSHLSTAMIVGMLDNIKSKLVVFRLRIGDNLASQQGDRKGRPYMSALEIKGNRPLAVFSLIESKLEMLESSIPWDSSPTFLRGDEKEYQQ